MSSMNDEEFETQSSNFSAYDAGSPMLMSPWNQTTPSITTQASLDFSQNRLISSLNREEGHIYSLAANDDILYTGSESKNIRVWKNMDEFSAFKSTSGLVKAIIIFGDKIFTGHQDGKVRVWKTDPKNPSIHRRSGTFPTVMDILKSSILPKNYIEVKRNKTALWIKHSDAISCLSMCEEEGLLYSASWDRTIKIWRIETSKCLESVRAHDDGVNSVVASVDGMVYSGSADGTVKVWKRSSRGRAIRHELVETLLKQESAITALAVEKSGSAVYAGCSDGLVNFWEREKDLVHGGVLKVHTLAVLCLACAGNLVFSGSADKNICVWRKEGSVHTCLSVLSGHTGPVKCLAVEEDKKESTSTDPRWVVYSGSLDKSVKVWSVFEMAPDLQQMAVMQQGMGGDFPWESIPSIKY